MSVRLLDGTLLITPSSVDKATIRARHLVRVFADGTIRHAIERTSRRGTMTPSHRGDTAATASSELGMHIACYAARAEVGAVVHAHPPIATGFATAGRNLRDDVLPELAVVVGAVALVPYARPGTPALADAMADALPANQVFLLQNHGVTVIGRSLKDAVLRLESLEQSARILAVAELLGGATSLGVSEVAALRGLWRSGR